MRSSVSTPTTSARSTSGACGRTTARTRSAGWWRSGSARSATTSSRSSSTSVRTQAGEDVAGVSAFTTFRGLSAEGEELRSMNNRLTWVLRKDADGAWKIAHEHTSAPAGDEGKVQLRR